MERWQFHSRKEPVLFPIENAATMATMNTLYGPILIVEDVPNVLELLEVTLRFKGYAVLTARNGEEALEIIPARGPY